MGVLIKYAEKGVDRRGEEDGMTIDGGVGPKFENRAFEFDV